MSKWCHWSFVITRTRSMTHYMDVFHCILQIFSCCFILVYYFFLTTLKTHYVTCFHTSFFVLSSWFRIILLKLVHHDWKLHCMRSTLGRSLIPTCEYCCKSAHVCCIPVTREEYTHIMNKTHGWIWIKYSSDLFPLIILLNKASFHKLSSNWLQIFQWYISTLSDKEWCDTINQMLYSPSERYDLNLLGDISYPRQCLFK